MKNNIQQILNNHIPYLLKLKLNNIKTKTLDNYLSFDTHQWKKNPT